MTKVTIYTDGSSIGNPGPGGIGVVLISGNYRKEISEGYRKTTNNRMELLSVITGLEALKKTGMDVTIYSDSKYVVDAVEKGWIKKWQEKEFKNKKNVDLWQRFLRIFPRHNVKFIWVKGHSGDTENERCDKLAFESAGGSELIIDEGYEKQNSDI